MRITTSILISDQRKQTLSGLLYRVIQQLYPSGLFPGEVRHLYRVSCKEGTEQPDSSVFMDTLVSILEPSCKTYLIIDALDECSQKKEVLEIILMLSRLENRAVKILVTSRQDREINDKLKDIEHMCLEGKDLDADLDAHISTRFREETCFSRLQNSLLEEARATLLRCGGRGL
jgi:hypothetical protein